MNTYPQPRISHSLERVLLYCINYGPEVTGVGRYAAEIGAYLEQKGVNVDVVTTPPHYPGWKVQEPYQNRYTTEREGRLQITRCPLLLREEVSGFSRLLVALSFAITSAPWIIWRAVTMRPQIILATEPTLVSTPAALLAARLCGARTVLHVQDLEVEAAFAVGHLQGKVAQRLALFFERMVLRRFDHIITISQRMRESLNQKGVPLNKLTIIRNWVKLECIFPQQNEGAYRKEWGAAPEDIVVLYAGNLGSKQALHLLLEAAARLQHNGAVRFIIAGDGPEKRKLVSNATRNVQFIPLQPEARLRELLCSADLHVLPQATAVADLVLPSKLGGMLASGKPILVQAEANTELYTFLEGAATIVRPGDAAALADAIVGNPLDPPSAARRRRELARSLSADEALSSLFSLLNEAAY